MLTLRKSIFFDASLPISMKAILKRRIIIQRDVLFFNHMEAVKSHLSEVHDLNHRMESQYLIKILNYNSWKELSWNPYFTIEARIAAARLIRGGVTFEQATKDLPADQHKYVQGFVQSCSPMVSKNKAHHRKLQIAISGMNRRTRESETRGVCNLEKLFSRIKYYGEKCWKCGVTYDSIDHVIPLTKGGKNWPSNLRPICKSCNSRKSNMLP